MKAQRQAKLLELICGRAIETQEELSSLLSKSGFDATQATISRDIKELNITKAPIRNGGYRYTVSSGENSQHSDKLSKIFKESVTTVEFAQNIIVIKTLPGLASGACSALDAMNGADIVGTLAGDDTAFLVMRTTEDAQKFCERIHIMLR